MKICNNCTEETTGINQNGSILDYCHNCGVVEGETTEVKEERVPNSQLNDLFQGWAKIF